MQIAPFLKIPVSIFLIPFCSIIFKVNTLYSQKVQVDNSVHSPLGISLHLNAVFGDLRSNHFHTGLDFSTFGKIKIPIHSIQEGFVSRIKISPVGYGKVLYVDHPNGKTSVYAHCERFSEKIEAFCRELQYSKQLNEIDTLLPKNAIKVEFGEVIAFSGNTGNSSGPHLHFEIRETKTEFPLNPLAHGFSIINDNAKPLLQEVLIYGLNEEGYRIPNKLLFSKLTYADGNYKLEKDIHLPSGFIAEGEYIGIAFKGNDKLSSKGSSVGIYGGRLILDNKEIFSFEFDSLDFNHSRYINEHIDYDRYLRFRKRYHKLFASKNNPLRIYKSKGFLSFNGRNKLSPILEVFDFSENTRKVYLNIYAPETFNPQKTHFDSSIYYLPENSMQISTNNITIEAEPFCFNQPIEKTSFFTEKNVITKAIKISSPSASDKKFFKINGSDVSTIFQNDSITSYSKNMGEITVSTDHNPPVVQPINFSFSNPTTRNVLKFKIYDAETAVKDYNLTVNGEWIRMYYDKKLKTVTSDPFTLEAENAVRFIVVDSYGNTKKIEGRLKKM